MTLTKPCELTVSILDRIPKSLIFYPIPADFKFESALSILANLDSQMTALDMQKFHSDVVGIADYLLRKNRIDEFKTLVTNISSDDNKYFNWSEPGFYKPSQLKYQVMYEIIQFIAFSHDLELYQWMLKFITPSDTFRLKIYAVCGCNIVLIQFFSPSPSKLMIEIMVSNHGVNKKLVLMHFLDQIPKPIELIIQLTIEHADLETLVNLEILGYKKEIKKMIEWTVIDSMMDWWFRKTITKIGSKDIFYNPDKYETLVVFQNYVKNNYGIIIEIADKIKN